MADERCEWWPAGDAPATGRPDQQCPNATVWSVGTGRNNWHLCESCAALPRFRRFRRRDRLNLMAALRESIEQARAAREATVDRG